MPAIAQRCEEEKVIGAQGAYVSAGCSERAPEIGDDRGKGGAGRQSVANVLTGVISHSAQNLRNHHMGGQCQRRVGEERNDGLQDVGVRERCAPALGVHGADEYVEADQCFVLHHCIRTASSREGFSQLRVSGGRGVRVFVGCVAAAARRGARGLRGAFLDH
jgi:hypothetical protein